MFELGVAEPRDKDDELVKYIMAKARKVFAITAQILKGKDVKTAMALFMRHAIGDDKLPILHSMQTSQHTRDSPTFTDDEIDYAEH